MDKRGMTPSEASMSDVVQEFAEAFARQHTDTIEGVLVVVLSKKFDHDEGGGWAIASLHTDTEGGHAVGMITELVNRMLVHSGSEPVVDKQSIVDVDNAPRAKS